MFEFSVLGVVALFVFVWYFSNAIKSVARGTNTAVQYGSADAVSAVKHTVSERNHKRENRREKKGYTLLSIDDINEMLGEQDD